LLDLFPAAFFAGALLVVFLVFLIAFDFGAFFAAVFLGADLLVVLAAALAKEKLEIDFKNKLKYHDLQFRIS
jgi:hypothetical protein